MRTPEMDEGEKQRRRIVFQHGCCPRKTYQIDEKGNGETGNGLRKVQSKQGCGSRAVDPGSHARTL